MAAKKSIAEKVPPTKAHRPTRRVEEIDFDRYMKTKATHKHVEEIGIADYLNQKKSPEAS